jgi:hypothetical protein
MDGIRNNIAGHKETMMDIADKEFEKQITNQELYSAAIRTIRNEVDDFMSDFYDDPSFVSNWGHQYFCDEDGERLGFDPHNRKQHLCPVCHKDYIGEPYDGVWVYFYRNMAILTGLKAATVYRSTKESIYLSYAKKILSFYAENYIRFGLHNKEDLRFESYETMAWGCGRIMPQGLNESIIGIRMILTLKLLDDDLSTQFKQSMYDQMFSQMGSLLRPQVREIHNISCWDLTALGVIGLYFADKQLLDFVFNSEYGMKNQLAKGVTKDGFWYEGSIHYNYFLLEGVTTLLLFCDNYGYAFGEAETKIIHDMLENGYSYAFDNQFFPNPNDGWPSINLKTFSYIYHMAAKVFGEHSDIGNILKNIEAGKGERTRLPLSESYYVNNTIPLERLLFTSSFDFATYTLVARKPYAYPDSNFAMIRKGPLNVFCKYGLNGPSHAHPDIMQIEIAYKDLMVSRDLSNAGYRSRLCNEWHRKTLCHNTVVCNGEDIKSTNRGSLLSFSDTSLEAEAKNVYSGIDYRRSLTLDSVSQLTDRFYVKAEAGGIFDYVFHLESGFELQDNGVSFLPASLKLDKNGYQHIQETRLVQAREKKVTLLAKGMDLELALTFNLEGGKQLYVCKSMDNPVNKTRTTCIVRSTQAISEFSMKLHIVEV